MRQIEIAVVFDLTSAIHICVTSRATNEFNLF